MLAFVCREPVLARGPQLTELAGQGWARAGALVRERISSCCRTACWGNKTLVSWLDQPAFGVIVNLQEFPVFFNL